MKLRRNWKFMADKIAILGNQDAFLGFRALGVEVFKPQGDPAAVLNDLAPEEYAVIFVGEDIAEEIPELIGERNRTTVQAVIVIPSGRQRSGAAAERIRQLVRRAVGADIM
jgi:V/A-type H+-transporting ATPase subunit F